MKISSASPDQNQSSSASLVRTLWLALAFGLIVLLLAVAYPMTERRPTLRIGINSWPGYEFLYLAQELGYFIDEGVDVRIVEFSHLIDSCRAFEKGHVDGIGGTLIELALARDRSRRDPRVVFVADWSDGADAVIVRAPNDSPDDLRGKRIGVEVGSLGSYVLAAALEAAGLDFGDVEVVPGDQVKIEREWRTGQIDVAVTYPPYSVRMLRVGDARTVFSSAEIPRQVTDVLLVDQSVLEAKGAECRAMLRGLERALAFYDSNPERASEIMADREGIEAIEFRRVVQDGIHCLGAKEQAAMMVSGGVIDQSIVRVERTLLELGLIRESGPGRPVLWGDGAAFWSGR